MSDDEKEKSAEETKMSKSEKLNRRRIAKKGWLTRDLKKADTFSKMSDEEAAASIDVIAQLIGSLKIKHDEFQSICEQYEETLDDDEEIEKDIQEHGSFLSGVNDAILGLEDVLKKQHLVPGNEQHPQSKNSGSDGGGGEAQSCCSLPGSHKKQTNVKRPKLVLPTFSGAENSNWEEFWDQFEKAIHKDDDLENVEKLQYLKGVCTKDASYLLEGLLLIDGNYEIALDLLKETYGKKSKKKDDLIDDLFALEGCTDPTKVKHLRKFVTDLIVNIRQLSNLGVEEDKYGVALIRNVKKKIPDTWIHEMNKKKLTIDNSISEILDFLKEELVLEEAKVREKESIRKTDEKQNRERIRSASALVATEKSGSSGANGSRERIRCIFCESTEHDPIDCRKSMSATERRDIVRKKKACFRCAKRGHRVEKCYWKTNCRTCGRLHIPLLCLGPNKNSENENGESVASGRVGREFSSPDQTSPCNGKTSVLLKTVRVTVNKKLKIRALCDTGCSFTLIDKKVAEGCGAKTVRRKRMTIQGVTGRVLTGNFRVVQVTLAGTSGIGELVIEAIEVPHLAGGINPPPETASKEFFNSGGTLLADYGSEELEVGLILGEDVYDDVMPACQVFHYFSGLKASYSIFGWVLHGKTGVEESSEQCGTAFAYRITLEDFWKTEHLGIDPKEDEIDVQEEFASNLEREEDGRYVAGLLWKAGMKEELPQHEYVARKRLQSLMRRLSDEDKKKYHEQVDEFLEQGYAEVAPIQPDGPVVCYLPHRAVKKKSSTTSFRIVHDASSKSKGTVSLNECLDSGPSLLPLLLGIIWRFRIGKVAVLGDLSKAFMQISLKKEDRDACRFLWENENGEEIKLRMKRVLFGSTCSPYMLQAVLRHHFESMGEMKETAKTLKESMYVDDMATSKNNDVEAIQVWEEGKRIFQEAQFKLRKLRTNSDAMKERFRDDLADSSEDSILGITWNTEEDALYPAAGITVILEDSVNTKRELASVLAQIHDPCGLISPVVTGLKIALQDAWLMKKNWDEEFDDVTKKKLKLITEGMKKAEDFFLPRWFGCCPESVTKLHVFCDASQRVYAAVAYLRIETNGKVRVSLVGSKSRLAPASGDTIPRLELLGAVIACRLGKTVAEELGLEAENTTYWTDSSIVYHWIRKTKTDLPGLFVRNRIKEIKDARGDWRWIPGEINPADLPTRGLDGEHLKCSELWKEGPDFLKSKSDKWPQLSVEYETNAYIAVEPNIEEANYIEDIVNPSRTSLWPRTVGSVVYILKWSGKYEENLEKTAEAMIFRQIQKKFFEKITSLKSLGVFADNEGFIRLGGRLQQVEILSWKQKHPIVLENCGAVRQLIQHVHKKNGHCGVGSTLMLLRERGLWILRAKKTISSAIKKCGCNLRYKAGPGGEITAPLPSIRTQFKRAFAVTGIDCGGPIILKEDVKVWFALFTCMSCRAIHLELLSDMSTESMLLAITRFTSRRSVPEEIWSDHGTNFVGLARLLRQREIRLEWRFILERSPWWGGAWERMIRVVKDCLKRSLGTGTAQNWQELETLLVVVERAVNKRPITHAWESSDGVEVPVPIYPEMFLHPIVVSENLEDLLRQKMLWIRDTKQLWQREYFHQVLGSSGVKDNEGKKIEVGDVVLIADESKKVLWKLGLIEKMYVGRDGRSRGAQVKVVDTEKTGKPRVSRLNRPVQKLYPLEIRSMQFETESKIGNAEEKQIQETQKSNADVEENRAEEENIDLEVEESAENVAPVMTRSGRFVKKPLRLEEYVTGEDENQA